MGREMDEREREMAPGDGEAVGREEGHVQADAHRVRDEVASLLGQAALGNPATTGRQSHVPMAEPGSPDEAAALLRRAAEAGWRVLPMGAGLAPMDKGPADLLVSPRRMADVVQYEPADLTVEVGAGMLLEALDGELARHRQWLPILPPGGGAVTLGGLVAVGLPGALAMAYGGPRDQLLGLTMADARGRVLTLGGRVVKNVAGFDLVRLACGSRGTLGLICRVSFRLHPRPAVDRTLIWTGSTGPELVRLGRRLAELPFPFATLEIHGRRFGALPELDGGDWAITLRAVGSDAAVQGMVDAAVEVAGIPERSLDGPASERFGLAAARDEGAARPQHRRRVRPTELESVLHGVAMAAGPGDPEGASGSVVADLRSGMFRRLRARDQGLPPLSSMPGGVRKVHGGLRRVFDPRGILPGSWRDGWP
ncbi:MAG: FAD-binding oxidoreductase [Gemmatimonadales bacterium]|nr:MAG: FAD-binding oxidoreductase [Gemmatimonadales bacterium]